MTRYVAFLRGVNVGGINIKMADLRNVFAGLGFENARTVLASGNVVFESGRRDRAKLKKEVEAALNEAFGYEAWIVLLDAETVTRIVAAYPFDEREGWQPYVLMSSDPAPLAELAELGAGLDAALERIELGDGVLYWEVERGQTLHSPFGKATGKKRYKSTTTNRNLRTLRKVLA
ncbi:DUF1697 domain-containing protein [Aldersonia sp. NBC_00410]|uniref:DUF1697 domain-containing protein n=1 Tax=Aldersonia sp. NBC_00410 TaxID=2975954 RepID=UPI0022542360|nr:DUF1697 domain-containing protein [Aldersonia sp. NBC_00410]MCX5042638.1 DUF1697 domain-containing protein [Aldersonia sp. NBC_00410]